MTDAEIRAFVPAEDFRLPDGRLLAVDEFLADVAQARKDGFSETRALADRFTRCMAAPIHDARGVVRTTLCLVVPVDTSRPRNRELLALLLERAASLSLKGHHTHGSAIGSGPWRSSSA